jgi:hypothetical protein
VAACVLCSLCAGLDRPRIDSEAVAIWLPEVSQAALIAIVRQLHLVCARHDAAPTMDRVPRSRSPSLLRAWGLHEALSRREGAARERLGSTRPRELGDALVGIAAGDPIARARLLGGLRLLPRGRFFRDGRDVYPRLLAALSDTNGSPS